MARRPYLLLEGRPTPTMTHRCGRSPLAPGARELLDHVADIANILAHPECPQCQRSSLFPNRIVSGAARYHRSAKEKRSAQAAAIVMSDKVPRFFRFVPRRPDHWSAAITTMTVNGGRGSSVAAPNIHYSCLVSLIEDLAACPDCRSG